MVSPAPSAAPGLSTRPTGPSPQHMAVISRQRGRVALRPVSAPVVIAAASPGLVLLVPTVTVLVVAALLHLALRRWASWVLSDDEP